MKREEVRDFLKKTSVKATGAVLAAAIAIGSIFAANYDSTSVPELVTYVDTTEMVSIEEEEVPLAEPQVTTSTKTKKTTKKIKMKSASKKTYTSKGSVKTKKTTKTQKTSKKTTTTQTVTTTQVSKAYKKKSKVCTQTTTTKTTVTKTVVIKSAASTSATTGTVTAAATSSTSNLSIAALAPKADSRVVYAWNTLGFSFQVNSSVNYSGLFDAKARTITLKSASSANVNYHELGHFVAFVAGNADTTAEFKSIFEAEKANYTAYNKEYVVKDCSEYFAESYKDYVLTPDELRQSRPQTYAAIEAALANITTSQVSRIATTYAAIWN